MKLELQTEGKNMDKLGLLACSPAWALSHAQVALLSSLGPLDYEYCHIQNHEHYLTQT